MAIQRDQQGPGNQVNQGTAQQEPKENGANQAEGQQVSGTSHRPGDANESGSAGSTRRDDTTKAPGKPR